MHNTVGSGPHECCDGVGVSERRGRDGERELEALPLTNADGTEAVADADGGRDGVTLPLRLIDRVPVRDSLRAVDALTLPLTLAVADGDCDGEVDGDTPIDNEGVLDRLCVGDAVADGVTVCVADTDMLRVLVRVPESDRLVETVAVSLGSRDVDAVVLRLMLRVRVNDTLCDTLALNDTDRVGDVLKLMERVAVPVEDADGDGATDADTVPVALADDEAAMLLDGDDDCTDRDGVGVRVVEGGPLPTQRSRTTALLPGTWYATNVW